MRDPHLRINFQNIYAAFPVDPTDHAVGNAHARCAYVRRSVEKFAIFVGAGTELDQKLRFCVT